VPVLRVNHVTLQDVLPGLRQVVETRLAGRTPSKRNNARQRIREEINHALDDFCCASDSVASRFQLPRRRRPDSLAARCCVSDACHQFSKRSARDLEPQSLRVVVKIGRSHSRCFSTHLAQREHPLRQLPIEKLCPAYGLALPVIGRVSANAPALLALVFLRDAELA